MLLHAHEHLAHTGQYHGHPAYIHTPLPRVHVHVSLISQIRTNTFVANTVFVFQRVPHVR
jgi:hypothetical protein